MIAPAVRERVLGEIAADTWTTVSEVRVWCAHLELVLGCRDRALHLLSDIRYLFVHVGRRDNPDAVPLAIPWLVEWCAMHELAERE